MSTNRKSFLLWLFLLLAFSFCLLAEASQKKSSTGSIFVADRGKLNIFLDNVSVGHEEFEIGQSSGSWVAKGNSSIKVPETTPTNVTGNLTLQGDGAPISYDWTAQTEKTNSAHILFSNGVAKMTLQMQGARPFEQDLTFSSPFVIVLDNNLYHQYAVLARVYDWSRKGTQNFSVLIPQELTPGTITVSASGQLTSGGKSYEGLKVVTSDLEVVLYLDSNHRLMRIEVPSAKVAVVRE
ncbi:MAG TPA: hypothetical protein VKH45_03840 [Candidatus Acidoferrum sp.]|nr:hypothetical protein [Candidatus Acidoferrum sp.]